MFTNEEHKANCILIDTAYHLLDKMEDMKNLNEQSMFKAATYKRILNSNLTLLSKLEFESVESEEAIVTTFKDLDFRYTALMICIERTKRFMENEACEAC